MDEKQIYQGVPSYAYQIAEFMVTRDGNLEFPDDTDAEIVNRLLDRFEEAGFTFPEDAIGNTTDRVDMENCASVTVQVLKMAGTAANG
ncbi:MAG: hypothetical protein IJ188_10530 [Clostridia bacterium]|nr:hypothetical protein [Clostridia bacterium]